MVPVAAGKSNGLIGVACGIERGDALALGGTMAQA